MTTEMFRAIFQDFNEPAAEMPGSAADDVPAPIGDLGDIRQEAWTDGYLKGRQATGYLSAEQNVTARLLTSLHELDLSASQAVDAASLAVADMLVNSFIATASADWSAQLMDRVRIVADRIKPALTVAPEFVLRDSAGAVRSFDDVTELARVLEAGGGQDVTIKWLRGEAKISRSALLEDLRDAIIPLTSGLENGQHARKHT